MTVSQKKSLPNIYLFYGADALSVAEKIASWKTRFAEKYGTTGINIFDCEEGDERMLPALKTALSGHTLFSNTSLVIIRNVFSKKAGSVQEHLCMLLPTAPDSIFVVLEDEKRDSKSELSKLLTKLIKAGTCAVEEFIAPVGPALKKWIAHRATKYGGSFDSHALTVFSESLQGQYYDDTEGAYSLWNIDSEIRKLVSAAQTRPISVTDIKELACLPVSAHVFELSDALVAQDEKNALHHIHHIIGYNRSTIQGPLLRTLAYLMTQVRSFLMLKSMEEDGMSEDAIASTLLWNPKRVWVVKKKLIRHTSITLKKVYARLLDLERTIKTGSADPLLMLDLTIKKTTERAQ